MQTLPKDILLLICDTLSIVDYLRFKRTCKLIYKRIKEKEQAKLDQLATEKSKHAIRYMAYSSRIPLLKGDDYDDRVIDNLYFYSIRFGKINSLAQMNKYKYPAPHDLVYTALKYLQFEAADWVHFRGGKMTDVEFSWLVRLNNEGIKDWLTDKEYFDM